MSDTVEVTIEVTQEMIDKGIPLCPWSCVLAQAFREYWPTARVGSLYVRALNESMVKMPDEMVDYRFDFDRGMQVWPRTFAFRVPKYLAPSQPPAPEMKSDVAWAIDRAEVAERS